MASSVAVASPREGARQPMLQGQPQPPQPEVDPRAAALASLATARGATVFGLFRYAGVWDRRLLAMGVLGSLAAGASQPLMAVLVQEIFKSIYIPNDDHTVYPLPGPHSERDAAVLRSCLIFVGLGAGAFLSTLASSVGFIRAAENQVFSLRVATFGRLLRKDVGWYDAHSPGEVATRLSVDVAGFRDGIGEALPVLLGAALTSLLGFAAAFWQDWRMAAILFAAVPFMVISVGSAIRIVSRLAKAEQELHAKAGGTAEATLVLVRTVAAFGGYERELAKYDAQLAAAERISVRSSLATGICIGGVTLIIYCTFSLGFYVGTRFVLQGTAEQCWLRGPGPPFGDCFTGATMLSTIFAVLYAGMGLASTGPSLSAVSVARGSAGRLFALADEPALMDVTTGEVPASASGQLEFRDVHFSYPMRPEVKVLNGLSLCIKAGTLVAFVGPSGSGKSTVVALLQRFYDPQGGSVLLDGQDLRALSLSWLRSRLALVQQEPVLFRGTVLENILHGRAGATEEQAIASARAANAHFFVSAFPNGYQTVLGDQGTQLSGGQKQRIAIARAILRDPSVLLLDEATSALDSESERVVQEALDRLFKAKRMTTVVVAHRLSTVQNADLICVLEGGRVLEQGSHAELLATDGSLYRELVHLQQASGHRGGARELFRTISRSTLTLPLRRESREATSLMAQVRRLQAKETSQPSPPVPIIRKNLSADSVVALPVPETLRLPGDEPGQEELPSAGLRLRSLSWGGVLRETLGGPGTVDRTHEGSPGPALASVTEEETQDIPVPLRQLWGMSWQDRVPVAMMFVAVLLSAAMRPLLGLFFSLASSLISQPPARWNADTQRWEQALDPVFIESRSNTFCAIFSLLGAATCLCTMVISWAGRRASESMARQLRTAMLRSMLRQDMAWFDRRTTGLLTERLASDVPLLRAFTFESVGSLSFSSISLLLGLAVAIVVSWRLTLCCLVLVPIISFGHVLTRGKLQQRHESEAAALVSEAVGNIRTVAAFGLESRMLESYKTLLSQELAKDRRISVSGCIATAYSAALPFLVYAVIILFSNLLLSSALLSPDAVMSILFPLLFCAGAAAPAQTWYRSRAKARGAVNRVFGTIMREPMIDPYSTAGQVPAVVEGRIEFQDVTFRYPARPEVSIFNGLSFTLPPGSTTAFVGPSGSGKSTVVALLLRFYDPPQGSVRFDGEDIRCLNLAWLRAQMALVQQEPVLFGGSILENIAYGKEGSNEEEVLAAARAANAHSFIVGLPSGYHTDVGSRGAQLSGGQKQRIAIARAVIRSPAVLLLDEATSALDLESERAVQEALDKLLKEKRMTTVVIAHRLSTVQNADQICVINQGVVAECGTHSELLELHDGLYKSLVSRQQANA